MRHRRPAIAARPERVVVPTARLRGRALREERPTLDAPFGSRGTQRRIAGLAADALIAPRVIEAAMDGPAFAACIREGLVPEIAPGPVVVPDTLAPHRTAAAVRAPRAHGCRFLHLPPCPPDLDRNEKAVCRLKAPRRIGARPVPDVLAAIGATCELLGPREC